MKKKLALMMAIALTMGLFAGCGSDENTEGGGNPTDNAGSTSNVGNTSSEIIGLDDIKVEECVTLGNYKGLEVTVPAVVVTDAEVEEHMQLIFNSNMTAENGITDRAVETGDTVNIDYEGKKDGVAFGGGTAADQQLVIGSGSFINGFEDGLIGVKPGETVDLNLTFPDPYQNAELAGQPVVFTVTVNYIYPGVDEYTDEAVASWENKNFATVEEMRQFSYDYLYGQAQAYSEYAKEELVVQAFIDQCQFGELPADYVAQCRANLQESAEINASMYNTDLETWCYYAYGVDAATFLESQSVAYAKNLIAFQAVANQEGLVMTDEELEELLLGYATQSGAATVDEFLGTNTRADYKEYYMYEDVLAYLIENAVITTEE